MKNKTLDIRRPIDIVIGLPQTLAADVLEDHQATRGHLMHACLELRRELGLESQLEVPAEDAEMQ